jgi:hypothetical protein
MELVMLDSGLKISKMVLVERCGQMEKHIKDNIKMVVKTEKEGLISLIKVIMRDNSL